MLRWHACQTFNGGTSTDAVYWLAAYNGELSADGNFVINPTVLDPAVNFARWNATTKLWEALGTGMNGPVCALRSFGGFLHAGGAFRSAGGVSTGGLARWNGSRWSAVGGFFSGTVDVLEVESGIRVIGGSYPGVPDTPNLAYDNGSNYDVLLPGGTNGAVRAVPWTGSQLLLGGDFTMISATTVNHAASFGFLFPVPIGGGTDGPVYAMDHRHNGLHVGGTFTHVKGTTVLSETRGEYDRTGVPPFACGPSPQTPNIGDSVTRQRDTTT